MKGSVLSTKEWIERMILALLFVGIGWLAYFVFSPLRPLFDRNVIEKAYDYLGRIGLIAVLLAAVLLVRRSKRLEKYGQVLLGLLIMAVVILMDWVFGVYVLRYMGITGSRPVNFAILKLNECFVVVSVIIALTLLSGNSLGSIYIQKGNLKLGLGIGLAAFCLAAAGSIPMAGLFEAQDITLDQIIRWLPWILIFILANATQEELLFRGLFLRKLEPFFGKFLSNALIVFIFTLLHRGVSYAPDELTFLVVLTVLALAWGYLMQKTDSIWGSILFHAGMDIPVILSIFSNL